MSTNYITEFIKQMKTLNDNSELITEIEDLKRINKLIVKKLSSQNKSCSPENISLNNNSTIEEAKEIKSLSQLMREKPSSQNKLFSPENIPLNNNDKKVTNDEFLNLIFCDYYELFIKNNSLKNTKYPKNLLIIHTP